MGGAEWPQGQAGAPPGQSPRTRAAPAGDHLVRADAPRPSPALSCGRRPVFAERTEPGTAPRPARRRSRVETGKRRRRRAAIIGPRRGRPPTPPGCWPRRADPMVAWDHVTRDDVLHAIQEYDRLGAQEFFAAHGFAPTTTYDLLWEERSYPPKAILGTAYELATGERLASGDFEGGKSGAVKVLGQLGFSVQPRRPAGQG